MTSRDLKAVRCIDARMIQDLVNVLQRIVRRLKPGKPGRRKGVTDRAVRQQTKRIRELWSTGRYPSQRALARRLGCDPATVSRALRLRLKTA